MDVSNKNNKEQEIIKSWEINAPAWINAIHNNEIKSRVELTNKAIINEILKESPNNLLDIGCGEGWLCRKLQNHNITTTGIDAIEKLITSAKSVCTGSFHTCTYNEILTTLPTNKKYDAIVCNFSLIGYQDVNTLIQTAPRLLNSNGFLYIQTLHPIYFGKNAEYKDGWRKGSWEGFNHSFTKPAPWYFRTIDTWQKLFVSCGLELINQLEPKFETAAEPTSIIFKCKKAD